MMRGLKAKSSVEEIPPEFNHDEEMAWTGFLIMEATGRWPSLEEVRRIEPTYRDDIQTVIYQINRQAAFLDDEG